MIGCKMSKIASRFDKNMTRAMLEQLLDLEDTQNEILECHRRALEAMALAELHLPLKTEDGAPVLFGSLTVMDSITDYWVSRRDTSIRMLPRTAEMDKWCDEHGFSNIAYGHLRRPG